MYYTFIWCSSWSQPIKSPCNQMLQTNIFYRILGQVPLTSSLETCHPSRLLSMNSRMVPWTSSLWKVPGHWNHQCLWVIFISCTTSMHSCKLQETDKNIDIKDIALHIIQTNTSHYNTLSILVEHLKLLTERDTFS